MKIEDSTQIERRAVRKRQILTLVRQIQSLLRQRQILTLLRQIQTLARKTS